MDHSRPVECPILIGRDALLALAEDQLRAVAGAGGCYCWPGSRGSGRRASPAPLAARPRRSASASRAAPSAPQDLQVPAALFLDLARTAARRPGFGELGPRLLKLLRDVPVTRRSSPRQRRRLVVFDVVDLIADAADAPTLLVSRTSSGPTNSASRSSESLRGVAAICHCCSWRPIERPPKWAVRHSGVARPPADPAARSGAPPGTVVDGPDRGHDETDPRWRPSAIARAGDCRLRANRRHPAPCRRADRRGGVRRSSRRGRHPQRDRPEHHRGCDPAPASVNVLHSRSAWPEPAP